MVAQGTCAFAKGAGKNLVLELKKITGGSRTIVVEAVTKALLKESRYTVKDAQVRPKPGDESSEDESEER